MVNFLRKSFAASIERWSVERMPVVDRAVLRLALFELRHEEATPTAVILAEAVRIAKEYSTERRGRFVNGVLANLARNAYDGFTQDNTDGGFNVIGPNGFEPTPVKDRPRR